MSTLIIKNRFTGATLFTCELPTEVAALSAGRQLGYAAKEALKARANLADAYLADAYLAGANLARANLADAYLAGANLADANLADAYLAGANLARANLADAYLAGANLARANLADANLADANLAGANLADAYLADANLADARNVPETNGSESVQSATREEWQARRATNARERALRYRERNPDVPVVEALDAKILERVEANPDALNMGAWHTCETTHCRAGWAIHLAGEAGYALERKYGDSARAGAAIYRASVGHVPHFYASNERALEDIRTRAAEQA
jgi:hypothetical protein